MPKRCGFSLFRDVEPSGIKKEDNFVSRLMTKSIILNFKKVIRQG